MPKYKQKSKKRKTKRTRKQDSIRGSPEYKQWKTAVLEFDHYTCQRCLCTDKLKLQVHHIQNFSQHIKLRFDVNNGITLCNKCHDPCFAGSFHSLYGCQDNDFEQLAEFINDFPLDNWP